MKVNTCELCERELHITPLTRHHLIPQTRHKNKKNKRDFDRADVKERIAILCKPCHKHIHAVISEKEMERQFNTISQLKEHPEVKKFVGWIANKPDGFSVKSRKNLRT